MCGRFTQNYTWEEVYKSLNVFGAPRNLRPHYNIAPTTIVDVIRREIDWKLGGDRDLTQPRLLVVEDHADRRLFPLDPEIGNLMVTRRHRTFESQCAPV